MNQLDKNQMRLIALIPAVLIFFSVNVIGQTFFGGLRLDVTEENIFTLSDETIPVFKDIKEPIIIRLYFSQSLGELSPQHAVYFQRVKDILEQYESLSEGMLKLQYFDPQPFSDVEDRAVGFGLQAVPLGDVGQAGYFGLAATNSTDDQEVIPFFNLERESFIEYDLTKLVYTLSNPDQPKIGLITSLPVDGGMVPGMGGMGGTPTPPWQIMDQMRDFFEVERLDSELEKVPADIDVIVMAQPESLSEKSAYLIDQWVLSGGKLVMFLDPNLETTNNPMGGMSQGSDLANAKKLVKAWGLELEQNVVAGDINSAVRVNAAIGGKPIISDYPAWMNLQMDSLNQDDAITGDLKNITMATSGILNIIPDTTVEIRPLIQTSQDSMRIPLEDVATMPDVVEIFSNFVSSGDNLLLAARVDGMALSAFPEQYLEPGNIEGEADTDGNSNTAMHIKESLNPIQVIVVADVDLLADRFWVQESNFLGQRLLIPTADNASFLINSLENLTGSPALSSLRGRGQISRPFTVIEQLRLNAEQNFRAKEKQLQARLESLQSEIGAIEIKQDGDGDPLITEDDQIAIANYRADLLSTRKELRDVQRSLREDIERLESFLKVLNIAGIPVIFGLGMIYMSYRRRSFEKNPSIN